MQKRTKYFLSRMIARPRLLLNVLKAYISYHLRLVTVMGQPFIIDIEPGNKCNFRCPHCEVTYSKWDNKQLTFKEYNKFVGHFPYALRVKLVGKGEPFINSFLPDMIKEACKNGIWCEVITNGSILRKQDLVQLAYYKNFQLTISFDAADKQAFENMRPGSNFDEIIRDIKVLRDGSLIDLNAWMLVTDSNKKEVEGVIRLLGELKFLSLALQCLTFEIGAHVERNGRELGTKRVDIASSRKKLRQLATDNNLSLSIHDKLYGKNNICPWPWLGAYVDVFGNVLPCCRLEESSYCNMGNLNKTDFDLIWNSKIYKDFRRRHKLFDIPSFCKGCYTS